VDRQRLGDPVLSSEGFHAGLHDRARLHGRSETGIRQAQELEVAKLYDMLPAEAGDTSEGRTAADNATVRAVFVIGPDKKIKAMLTYPMSQRAKL
jgi:alkyl hydroperoxide reductase subunit AhpC